MRKPTIDLDILESILYAERTTLFPSDIPKLMLVICEEAEAYSSDSADWLTCFEKELQDQIDKAP